VVEQRGNTLQLEPSRVWCAARCERSWSN